ncbi:MAG: pyrroline-5-carboxylate reductase [Negativicutes bacterium]|nr:pyrroline-5-carboxylate reductase [Negativicutes bacterium]
MGKELLADRVIGFIGAGTICEAFIGGMLAAGVTTGRRVIINDTANARRQFLAERYQVRETADKRLLVSESDIVFLSVKPQVMSRVLAELAGLAFAGKLIISVAAGVTLATLEATFTDCPVIRSMPNTPVAVGAGMSVLFPGRLVDEQHLRVAQAIFNAVGDSIVLDEQDAHAVTGLSGSGPAYGYIMIDALASAGVASGLSREVAEKLAAQTMLGAAKMVMETKEHPAKLRDMVSTPAGTTIAGIHELERHGLRAVLMDGVMAAVARSRQLLNKDD